MRTTQWFSLVAVLLCFTSSPAFAEPIPVANAKVGKKLSRSKLKRYFGGGVTTWPDGKPVVLILPPSDSPEMAWITNLVGMPEAAYRRKILKAVFSGLLSKPVKAKSSGALAKALAETEGGLTAIEDGQQPDGTQRLE